MAIRLERHSTQSRAQFRAQLRKARLTAAAIAISAFGVMVMAPTASANQRDGQGAYQQWERMPPQQRERILQEQERFKRLPPSEQERLRREYQQRRQ
ncbi:MAG: hypothetical protein B7Z79_01655 [Thiomonas sp. 20-64-9]|jgi:hypothetical protein|uniref:Uncharacterized protein n=2 Tax=Burkholderiales genera incertae sedis TaxID=224471 RepID=D5X1X9_THIK1|nr:MULTISPECIES: DUF3106 domain-containing protein [Thiomonas]MBN8776289.1 DUF3106 domain-containing protein [Thiomonas arsenitoxydans]OYV31704.1 MAG: hypothetical protein B7Z79_01655 [Thiomonas sp. 20-64-9]OZB72384.1 MAG: hypothetical protein B7X30_00630 [Thiomonas sp. 13-64-67]OZB72474.1 MAG: hypothetical protein B7X36_12120 [Thiomonas sp. 14-64-326]